MSIKNIVTTRTVGTNVPRLYDADPGSRIYTNRAMPVGVTGYNRRPAKEDFIFGAYLCGQFSVNLSYFYLDNSLWKAGINAPAGAPTIATTGSGVVTGICIGYIEARHKIGSTIVAKSNLSPGSSPVSFTNQQRQWTLPTVGLDTRVTHLGLFASMDGALPRFVAEVTYGTASYTDNVATGALGDTPPIDTLGNLKNARGVPPYCRFIKKFHDRAWYGGDPNYPYRIWFSEIGEPESVGANNYLDTRDRETVTGLGVHSDQLLASGISCFYEIRGWRATDFVMRKVHSKWGCISHFGMKEINVLGTPALLIASQIGNLIYDGGFKFVQEDFRNYWTGDYEANPDTYETLETLDDPDSSVVRVKTQFIGNSYAETQYYIGHYQRWHGSSEGGGVQMDWTLDFRGREDTAQGYQSDSSGRKIVFVGNRDGYLRRENVFSDGTDDGDVFDKTIYIRHKHMFPLGPGGEASDGGLLHRFWVFLRSELSAWVLNIYMGDEEASARFTPDFTQTVPASAGVDAGGGTLVAESCHNFDPEKGGRGFTFEIVVAHPKEVVFRGFGGTFGPGAVYRGRL